MRTRAVARWASDELAAALAELTAQQAEGVQRIVGAELNGKPLSSLLDVPDQICTSTTYYGSGKRPGWRGKPAFNVALTLARRDYRKWMLEHGTDEALTVLATTAPDAARMLRQQVTGDDSALAVLETMLAADDPTLRVNAALHLGETGLPRVIPALQAAWRREKEASVQRALVDAMGMIAAGATRNAAAAESVLDRADLKTASKGTQALTGGDGGPMELGIFGVIGQLSDEEIEQMLGNLKAVEDATASD